MPWQRPRAEKQNLKYKGNYVGNLTGKSQVQRLQDNRTRVSFVSLASSYSHFCRNSRRPPYVIPFNCIAHPFRASSFAWLGRARARARSELGRFSMKAQLFREINGRFLPDELGDPFKFEELFIYIQFWNVPVDSLLQSDFLFHWFHTSIYGDFKTFFCNIVLLS